MAFVLTIVAARAAQPLTDAMLARVQDAAGATARPHWLAAGEAADLSVPSPAALESAREAVCDQAIDLLLTRADTRRCRLLVADMDSTIVLGETLDDLAARAGLGEAVAAITQRSMNGQTDFRDALRQRVAMLRGLSLDALEATWRDTALMPGARLLVATMRAHGAHTALVSGGFTFFTERVAALCGFDSHYANVLVAEGACLAGRVTEPILGPDTKRETLLRLADAHAVPTASVMALGDGANDLPMLAEAGLGIAYHAKPIVTRAIANRIEHADLRAALFAQGYPVSQFVGE